MSGHNAPTILISSIIRYLMFLNLKMNCLYLCAREMDWGASWRKL